MHFFAVIIIVAFINIIANAATAVVVVVVVVVVVMITVVVVLAVMFIIFTLLCSLCCFIFVTLAADFVQYYIISVFFIDCSSIRQHPNICFTMETEIDNVLPFLDVLIDNTHRSSVVTSTFRKTTFMVLLTNYFSLTPLSYKIGLIRTLIDRVFKINITWLGFHKDITKLVFVLRKNLFPVHLIDKCVYRYSNAAIDRYGSTRTLPPSNITSQGKQYFYKLPYLGRFSTVAQRKIRRLVNNYCNDLDIKPVFTTFKLRNLFSLKDSILREFRSRVIYKFTCVCCNACYIGETGRHLSTRVRDHLSSDKSHTFSNTY